LFVRAVFENVNAVRSRHKIDSAKCLAKKGVEQGGFSRFYFTHDDEKEWLPCNRQEKRRYFFALADVFSARRSSVCRRAMTK
jgi:hypothetical protein